jgi:hypothetical protein
LGEIINAFQQMSVYSSFHSSESNKTQIKLAPYEKTKGSGEYAVKYTAFGLSFTRNGSDSFKIPLEPGEAVRLTSFINHFFNILDNSRKVPNKTEQAVPTKRETVSAPVAKAPKQEVAADAEEMDF